jgi:hypothetical protein
MTPYAWLKLLHVFAVLLFFVSHGASMGVAFRLSSEKDPDRLLALLDLSRWSIMPMSASLLVVLVLGVVLTFMGHWSHQIWPWLAFILLIAMSTWMTFYGRKVYSPIRKSLGMPYMTGFGKENPAVDTAASDEIRRLIGQSNPHLLALVAILFTALSVWLMIFKPF